MGPIVQRPASEHQTSSYNSRAVNDEVRFVRAQKEDGEDEGTGEASGRRSRGINGGASIWVEIEGGR